MLARPRLQGLPTAERRRLVREPTLAGQERGGALQVVLAHRCPNLAVEDVDEVVAREAVLGGAGLPALVDRRAFHAARLRSARVERGHFSSLAARRSGVRHGLANLGPPLAEALEDVARQADDLRRALVNGGPLDAQFDGQVPAQRALVEVAGGLGVGVERCRVQRGPAAIEALGHVRRDDVREPLRAARR